MSKSKTVAKSMKSKSKTKKLLVIDWVPPFPPADPDILVRAKVIQELTVNGSKKGLGDHIMAADFAHQHSSALAAPDIIEEE